MALLLVCAAHHHWRRRGQVTAARSQPRKRWSGSGLCSCGPFPCCRASALRPSFSPPPCFRHLAPPPCFPVVSPPSGCTSINDGSSSARPTHASDDLPYAVTSSGQVRSEIGGGGSRLQDGYKAYDGSSQGAAGGCAVGRLTAPPSAHTPSAPATPNSAVGSVRASSLSAPNSAPRQQRHGVLDSSINQCCINGAGGGSATGRGGGGGGGCGGGSGGGDGYGSMGRSSYTDSAASSGMLPVRLEGGQQRTTGGDNTRTTGGDGGGAGGGALVLSAGGRQLTTSREERWTEPLVVVEILGHCWVRTSRSPALASARQRSRPLAPL